MNNILQIDGCCVYTLCIICAWHFDNLKAYLSKLDIVNFEFGDFPGVLNIISFWTMEYWNQTQHYVRIRTGLRIYGQI